MKCAAFHYTDGSVAFGTQQNCGIQHPISLLIFLNLISQDANSIYWNSLHKKVRKSVALISLLDINWSKAKTAKTGNKAVLTSG